MEGRETGRERREGGREAVREWGRSEGRKEGRGEGREAGQEGLPNDSETHSSDLLGYSGISYFITTYYLIKWNYDQDMFAFEQYTSRKTHRNSAYGPTVPGWRPR